MQTLKDAATLAVLILLALTVRIDIGAVPLEIDLDSPAIAAELPPAGSQLPDAGSQLPDVGSQLPDVEPAQPCSMQLVPVRPPQPPLELRRTERRLVWESNGRRFEIVLDGREDPVRAPTASRPRPCDGPFDPELAC